MDFRKILPLFSLLILVVGINTSHAQANKEFFLPYYDEIKLGLCYCDLELHQGVVNKLEIVSEGIKLNNIEPRVLNDILSLKSWELYLPGKRLILKFTFTRLKLLEVERNAIVINIDTLKTRELRLKINGESTVNIVINVESLELEANDNANITIKGIAEKQYIILNKNVKYNGADLFSKEAVVDLAYQSEAIIQATEKIVGETKYGGMLIYKGDPILEIRNVYGGRSRKL